MRFDAPCFAACTDVPIFMVAIMGAAIDLQIAGSVSAQVCPEKLTCKYEKHCDCPAT